MRPRVKEAQLAGKKDKAKFFFKKSTLLLLYHKKNIVEKLAM